MDKDKPAGMFQRGVSLAGKFLLVVILLLFAINHFVVVGYKEDSRGIIENWFLEKIAIKRAPNRFFSSLENWSKAVVLMDELSREDVPFEEMDLSLVVSYLEKALDESENVPREYLDNSHSPELGKRFNSEYKAGIRLLVSAFREKDFEKYREGANLCDSFRLWFSEDLKKRSFSKK